MRDVNTEIANAVFSRFESGSPMTVPLLPVSIVPDDE